MTGRVKGAHSQKGFGLIEVLAAVLVLAVGVVGFAGLQMRAVQTSGDSYYRTQAMAIAQDLAERVRINYSQKATYLSSTTWTAGTVPGCMTANCTPAQMVAFDAQGVMNSAASLLPDGRVKMEACPVATNGLNCIYVAWDGLQPTGGSTGECVDATGKYKLPAGKPFISCVMLEVM